MRVVVSDNVYGGTLPPVHEGARPATASTSPSSTPAKPGRVERAGRRVRRCSWTRDADQPAHEVSDIAALAALAHRREALLVVDNTFMRPYFQRPLALGADVVVHSTTKFLNGHSDIDRRRRVVEQRRARRVAALRAERRGRDPLALRLLARPARHQDAGACAWSATSERPRRRRLPRAHPKVRKACSIPASPTIPATLSQAPEPRLRRDDHLRARFAASGRRVCCAALRLCSLAESLGGVETLICHPATMTHASVPEEERDALGIADGLVRISRRHRGRRRSDRRPGPGAGGRALTPLPVGRPRAGPGRAGGGPVRARGAASGVPRRDQPPPRRRRPRSGRALLGDLTRAAQTRADAARRRGQPRLGRRRRREPPGRRPGNTDTRPSRSRRSWRRGRRPRSADRGMAPAVRVDPGRTSVHERPPRPRRRRRVAGRDAPLRPLPSASPLPTTSRATRAS